MKAIKKQIPIEVWQLNKADYDTPSWVQTAFETKQLSFGLFGMWWVSSYGGTCNICAKDGDYLLQGPHGEIYPCKKEEFEKLYDLVY